jgi:hypothetical protein
MSSHHQAHRLTTSHQGQSLRSIQEQTNILKDIKQNTSETTINAGDIELHVDGLETLIQATNDKLDSFSGHSNNTTAIGDGSTQLRVLPLGYNQSAGQVRSLLCDSVGHQQIDVVSSALPSGGATSANQSTSNGHLATVAGAVSGTEMQVDVLTMPTVAVTLSGGATEAKQDDGITHLATIAGDTTSIDGKITACNTGAVTVSASALPSGAATQTTLNDAEVHLGSIDGKITACNTGAVTVSASALPSGAATQSTLNDAEVHLGSIDGKITACNTGAVTVSASALPSGAATQTTLNDAEVHLGSIDGKITQGYDLQIASGGSGLQQNLIYGRDNSGNLDALKTDSSGHLEVVVDDFVKGQAAMAASFPVTISSNQSNLNVNANISGTVVDSNSGNKSAQTQRIVIATDDVNLSAIKSSLDNLDNAVDGNYLNVNANIAGTDVDSNSGNKSAATQRVVIADDDVNLSAIKTSLDNLDNAVDGNYLNINQNIAGTDVDSNSGNKSAQTQRIVIATDDVNVSAIKTSLDNIDNAVDGNYLNVNANIAGTDVDANSGNKSAATQRVVIADDDTNLSAIKTSVELLDDAIGTDGSAGPAKCISIGGTNPLGGAIQEIAVDGDGHLSVDILSSALPSGAATELSVSATAAKATLLTSAEVKELLSGVTINAGALSSEFDTENYERVRFFGETNVSTGTDIIFMGSNTSGGTFYVLGENLRSETLSSTHYVYASGTENLPRYIKILNKSGSTNYVFTKLYLQGSGGRLAV